MKAVEPSSMRWPPHILAVCALVLFMPSPAAAAGLKLRDRHHLAQQPGEEMQLIGDPCAEPSGESAAAPPSDIGPGSVVQVTCNIPKYQNAGMVGKTYVVKSMGGAGACIPAPDSESGVWCLPLSCVVAWADTEAANTPPVASQGAKAVGLPTRPNVEVVPPGRNDAPWDYTLKGQNLMNPIAPPFDSRVDFEKTSMPLPPWEKVKRVVSIECMEKLHKDPSYKCQPEDFVDGQVVNVPTPAPVVTVKEAKALRKRIDHLESQLRSLTPRKEKEETGEVITVPGVTMHDGSMNDIIRRENRAKPRDFDAPKMNVGEQGSRERMISAGGYGEQYGQKLYAERKDNEKMVIHHGFHAPAVKMAR